MGYFLNIATLLSQICNTVFLFGNPDQSISARSYISRDRHIFKVLYPLINCIFFWQLDHCYESHLVDVGHAQEVLDMDK